MGEGEREKRGEERLKKEMGERKDRKEERIEYRRRWEERRGKRE